MNTATTSERPQPLADHVEGALDRDESLVVRHSVCVRGHKMTPENTGRQKRHPPFRDTYYCRKCQQLAKRRAIIRRSRQ